MSRPALVIFDCDGVLVDSEPIADRVVAANIARHGGTLTEDEAAERYLGAAMRVTEVELRAAGVPLPPDWLCEIYAEMYRVLEHEVAAIDGAEAALDRLDAAAMPYAVGSNGPRRKMEITLGRTGLWDRVAGRVFSAYEVGIAKPDPGLYLHVAWAFGADPGDCVVIEDSRTGAAAARRAGMRCLGYAGLGPGAAAALAGEGATPFAAMAELPALLGL